MSRLKIAIFSGSIPSTTFIEHLIKGVAKNHIVLLFGVIDGSISYDSHQIKIYQTPQSKTLNALYSFYRLVLLSLKRPGNVFRLMEALRQLDSIYSKWTWFSKLLPIILYRPDILHLQWAKDVEYYMVLKKVINIRILLSLRGAHINYSPICDERLAGIYQETFPEIEAFHAVSHAIGLEAQKYGAKSKQIKVIYSPIPLYFFNAFEPYKKRKSTCFQLVSVGRFHWKKGYTYMLNALFLLKQRGISICYTIIGPENYSEEVLFQVHQLGLEEQVEILPKLPQSQLISRLKAFDALVLPSLEEGIANVVLEAMAVGVPVISTNCGGMAEVVKPGETGWLVPVRDSDALAEAIVNIMGTPEPELQRITENAHLLVKQRFNADERIAEFLEFYEDVSR